MLTQRYRSWSSDSSTSMLLLISPPPCSSSVLLFTTIDGHRSSLDADVSSLYSQSRHRCAQTAQDAAKPRWSKVLSTKV